MGGSEKRKSAKKSGKTMSDTPACYANTGDDKQAVEQHNSTPATGVLKDSLHDYCEQNDDSEIMLAEEVIPPLPDTPYSSPAVKLRRTDNVNATVISTQLSELTQLVKNRSDGLEKLIGENSRVIKDMKEEICRNTERISGMMETIEFVCSEVKSLKKGVDSIDSRAKKEEINATEREKRLAHLERSLHTQMEPENPRNSRERKRKRPSGGYQRVPTSSTTI